MEISANSSQAKPDQPVADNPWIKIFASLCYSE